jgi:anthranilate phosphoribosyltransferase
MHQSFTNILENISRSENLSAEEAEYALQQIVDGEVSNEEVAAFLFGMRMKGETVKELTAFVKVMREAAIKVDVEQNGAVDLCGTGGDGSGTFNISTTAMFVVAGAGVPVLKHGNRSISSKCGSADVLELLGARPNLQKKEIENLFRDTEMAFMFAPNFHPAMKYVMPARRSLKMRTFFNMLGPLLNPAGVKRQVIGTFSLESAEMMIQILSNLESEKAFTVSAKDGMDEVSLVKRTTVFELTDDRSIDSKLFDPQTLGFEMVNAKELAGGDSAVNAEILKAVLKGKSDSAKRNIVILNSAFAILASGKTENLSESVELASDSIQSGRAYDKLKQFITATNDLIN